MLQIFNSKQFFKKKRIEYFKSLFEGKSFKGDDYILIFGIDISRDNIFNRLDGACARYLNYRKDFIRAPRALFVKGDSLLNNGTGFMTGKSLSSHIGFIENRALFFNGSKIPHSDLQSFGDSSKRYTLNIFYKESEWQNYS